MFLDKIWTLFDNKILAKSAGCVLLFPASTLDGFVVIGKLIKIYFLKKWAKHIHREITKLEKTPKNISSKNLAGLGGQEFRPVSVSWRELVAQTTCPSLRQWSYNQNVVQEHLFFAYFGPLEAWCEQNCQYPFYLWTDDYGIHRYFTNPIDNVLWNLTWENPMPSMTEIEKIYR